jgi:predicted RNA-binding Zn-ribbon protein involved in translation (DUF1610 family)
MLTAEQYKEEVRLSRLVVEPEWSEPKYICPKCGGYVRKNLRVALLSSPLKYLYKCQMCDYEEYLNG